MPQQSLMLLQPMIKEKMHLQENKLFDLVLGIKVTVNVAQYLLHHVPYSATKFEVATLKVLGGEAFTRNVLDRRTTGRLWNKINKPFFLKKKWV